MQRCYDTSLIKSKRSYTVKRAAKLFDVDENTVRKWEKVGLTPIDQSKPKAFHGPELKRFLDKRQADRKRPCRDGEIFCSTCRIPKRLEPGSFYFEPTNTLKLLAKGKCTDCATRMTRIDVTANRDKLIRLFGYASKATQ